MSCPIDIFVNGHLTGLMYFSLSQTTFLSLVPIISYNDLVPDSGYVAITFGTWGGNIFLSSVTGTWGKGIG